MAEPPITIQAYHVSSGSNLPVHRIVIHSTSPGIGYPKASANGMARSTAHYFQSSSSGGSAHYIVDAADEEHCVHDKAIAWHAPPNQGSIGIEICGEAYYTNAEWVSDKVTPLLVKAAARAAELCHRFGVPVVKLSVSDLRAGKRGICGHVDVSNAWHQSDHTDPGPHFPWPEFIALVKKHMPSVQSTPTITVPKFLGRIITLGMHGNDVMQWQHGMDLYHGWQLVVDGQYGPHSVAACKTFQRHHSLAVDGEVGPKTWAATFKRG